MAQRGDAQSRPESGAPADATENFGTLGSHDGQRLGDCQTRGKCYHGIMGMFNFSRLGGGLLALCLASGCASSSPRSQPAAAPTPAPTVNAAPPVPPPTQPGAPSAVAVAPQAKADVQPPPRTEAASAFLVTALDKFVADRPAAAALLRQHPPLAQWFRTEWNQPGAFPIIWDNQPPHTNPVAENTASSQGRGTTIRVSPTLSPVDQLMALFYETCNAGGRTRIISLGALATQGRISRQDFIDGINESEFAANHRLKETFPTLLPLSRAQLARDPLYQHVLAIPDTFAEYKSLNVRIHNMNYLNAQEMYGREYDDLVRRAQPAVRSPQQ